LPSERLKISSKPKSNAPPVGRKSTKKLSGSVFSMRELMPKLSFEIVTMNRNANSLTF
jgi:hypothetical protein